MVWKGGRGGMPKTLAFYMRLSSEDQTIGESDSIKNQRDLLYRFVSQTCDFQDWKRIEFKDDGYSGTNFDRPQIKRLLTLVRRRQIDCIIVKDLSRFGRNYIDVCDYLEQVFPLYGVRFIAVNDSYDSNRTKGSSVSMDVAIKSLVSELYSRDLSLKIRSSNKVRWLNGKYLGTIAFYGYELLETGKNKLVIDDQAATVVRRIFQMAADGRNPNEIAVLLNEEKVLAPLAYRRKKGTDKSRGWNIQDDRLLWTRFSIKRILCDQRYTGKLVSYRRTKADVSTKRTKGNPKEEWIIAMNTHEPIVTQELFLKAGIWFTKRRASRKQVSVRKNPMTGILKCGYCHHNLTRSSGNQAYYYCYMAKYEESTRCSKIKVMEKVFSDILLAIINMQVSLVLRNERCLTKISLTNHERIQNLKKEIQMKREEIKKISVIRKHAFEEYCFETISKAKYAAILESNTQQTNQIYEKIHELQRECSLFTKDRQQNNEQGVCQRSEYAEWLNKDMVMLFVKEILVFEGNRFEIVWNYRNYYK